MKASEGVEMSEAQMSLCVGPRNDLICYCFEYSVHDIQEDVRAHDGRSTILEKIVAAKKVGGCQCATTHPQGR